MTPTIRRIFNIVSETPANPFPAPVFMVGLMRSGTTFLVDKMTQHPQLLKLGVELNDIWSAIGGADCVETCSYKTEADATFEAANNMSNYIGHFIEDSKSIKRHLMRWRHLSKKGSGRIFYDWEQIIPVNKSPHLTNKIRYVHALFPTSKVLLIVRSIQGHCSSQKVFFDREYQELTKINYLPSNAHACWTRIPEKQVAANMEKERIYPNNFSLIPQMWIRLNALALRDIQKLPPKQFAVVAYEDLVQHQAIILAKLFDFLQLDPKHQAAERKMLHTELNIINSNKGNPLDKWKKQLTSEEIKSMEQCISQNQAEYNFIMETLNNIKIKA